MRRRKKAEHSDKPMLDIAMRADGKKIAAVVEGD